MARSIVVVTRFADGMYVASFVYPSDFTALEFRPEPSIVLGVNTVAGDIPGLDPAVTLPNSGETKLFSIDT